MNAKHAAVTVFVQSGNPVNANFVGSYDAAVQFLCDWKGDTDNARRLALAVLAGDNGAALALADLVTETVNGDATTATGRLIAEAVQAERDACAKLVGSTGIRYYDDPAESLRAIIDAIKARNTP